MFNMGLKSSIFRSRLQRGDLAKKRSTGRLSSRLEWTERVALSIDAIDLRLPCVVAEQHRAIADDYQSLKRPAGNIACPANIQEIQPEAARATPVQPLKVEQIAPAGRLGLDALPDAGIQRR